jgi:hypothetical protein
MALSPNYGFPEPDNSSLVKNGAQDIRALGDAIDTSVWNVGYGQAGKNKIINGDLGIWQRGTSFSNPTDSTFTADRWICSYTGTGATRTITREAFTAGTAPVAGYEGQYFLRYAVTVAGSGSTFDTIGQRIEDVRTFAGQTITLSFWAKAASGTPAVTARFRQNFGSGGSAAVDTDTSFTLSTTWTRYTASVSLPSIAGKTIGASNYLWLQFRMPINTTFTIDYWGVQVEYGSKATPFQTASGGSIQGELAMCQRYYQRFGGQAAYQALGSAMSQTTTNVYGLFTLPVPMRVIPTSFDLSTLVYQQSDGGLFAITAAGFNTPGLQCVRLNLTTAGATANRPGLILTDNSTSGHVGFSAEL